ncbi:splicing factor 3A subunit 1-like [Tubulanus polymorphus]|uniref:splicing factor 3A subunit 1-like n=1 Tax=Tubulanus polymorphus TaxID=672921 RepID=UPI003DA1D72C
MPEALVQPTAASTGTGGGGEQQKSSIGIIYPPPEVRNIVDKTASFVARNGPEFETRIRQNEINNPKFNFLNANDPYHAYYQYKVKEFKEGKGQEPAAPKGTPVGISVAPAFTKTQEQQSKLIEPIVPSEPPPQSDFIADPPSISAFDLDVVKLTAQFVARNGRQFLTNLMNREQRNYQFDFLRPQHSLFTYFTKLVEQYTMILIPPKDLNKKLSTESINLKEVLDQVIYRVEWAKYQERERRKIEEAAERERVAYAQIDWHDFVVVETVDFQPNEQGNLPPPTTPEEVGARVIAQQRVDLEESNDVEMEVESGDETDSSDDDEDAAKEKTSNETRKKEEEVVTKRLPPPPPPSIPPPPLPSEVPRPPPVSEIPQPPPLPPTPDHVVVRKDYDPKAAKASAAVVTDQYLISPITGEKIAADKVAEHVRIGLLDRKWIEQRDRSMSEKREQEEVFAPGVSIGSNLKKLSERRTDIFGIGLEETQIGKKIGEEEKRVEKVTWDGHTASMEKVTQKARENISIQEQIHLIHKVKGLLPDENKEKIGPTLPSSKPTTTSSSLGGRMPPATSSSTLTAPMKPLLPPTSTLPKPKPLQQARIPAAMMASMPRPPPIHRPAHMSVPPVMMMPAMPQPPMMPGMPPLPPPPMMPPMPMQVPHPMSSHQQQHAVEDEPPTKKAKTEDSLLPEEEFLRRYKAPVTFQVQIPNMPDKSEWKLTGQMLTLTLPLTDNVSVIKAKLHEELGMPAGKQKLQHDGLFIKDSNTLAFYNFTRGAVVQLQLKERGGRKK